MPTLLQLVGLPKTQKYAPKNIALGNPSVRGAITTTILSHGCTTTLLPVCDSIKSWFKSVCLILILVHTNLLPSPTL